MFITFTDDTKLGKTAVKGEGENSTYLERLEIQTSPRYQSQPGTIH